MPNTTTCQIHENPTQAKVEELYEGYMKIISGVEDFSFHGESNWTRKWTCAVNGNMGLDVLELLVVCREEMVIVIVNNCDSGGLYRGYDKDQFLHSLLTKDGLSMYAPLLTCRSLSPEP